MSRVGPSFLFQVRLLLVVLVAASGGGEHSGAEGAEAIAGRPAAGGDADGLIASPEPGWPQWRGPRRDGISSETGLLPTWPEGGPRVLWQVGGLGQGWSSPIIVNGWLYVTGDVGEDLVVFAFDLNGQPLWQVKNGAAWQGAYPGARACCVYADGRIYHLNAHGRLACWDAATGVPQWAVDVLGRFQAPNITWAISECLLVDGRRVIVTPGGPQALLAALDTETGQTIWTTPPLEGEPTSYSSPILFRHAGRRLLANCSAGHGFGVDADDGRLLWTVPLRNRFETNVSTPVYGDGQIFYVTPYAEQGRAYRLVTDGRDIRPEQVWQAPLDTVTGSGVLVDQTLFTAGYRQDKYWFAVDWPSGQTRHELQEFTTGAAVYAEGRLYIFDEKGAAGLVRPTEHGLEVAGRLQLVADRVRDAWAHPVLLDGRLYLRYHDTLWCLDVRGR